MRAMLTVGVDEISDRFGGHFDGWSDEDVIRAYLVHHLRKQEDAMQSTRGLQINVWQPVHGKVT